LCFWFCIICWCFI